MEVETGTMGLIGWNNQRVSVDGWEIDHRRKIAKAFCDLERFKERFNLNLVEYRPVLGSDWLVRFDNESHLYYGSTRCFGMAFPEPPSEDDSRELVSTTLALHFHFQHDSYGPYHIAEARAMARRGNDMFMDLLTLEEIEIKVAQGDPVFTNYINNKIFY